MCRGLAGGVGADACPSGVCVWQGDLHLLHPEDMVVVQVRCAASLTGTKHIHARLVLY